MTMDAAGVAILGVNAALAVGCGWPVATWLASVPGMPAPRVVVLTVLLGVYLLESAAFAASMATGVLSIVLAAATEYHSRLLCGRGGPRGGAEDHVDHGGCPASLATTSRRSAATAISGIA